MSSQYCNYHIIVMPVRRIRGYRICKNTAAVLEHKMVETGKL